jgi:hypothetical protein
MPRSRDDLGAGDWAVLALLAERPTHGFAVARAMSPEGEIGKVWTMRRPLVYRAIEHVRDARSLLTLKLLFLGRGDGDQTPLLTARRKRFESLLGG